MVIGFPMASPCSPCLRHQLGVNKRLACLLLYVSAALLKMTLNWIIVALVFGLALTLLHQTVLNVLESI